MEAVRIEKNNDGSYSAYIYSHCIYVGTYKDCVMMLSFHGEYV